MTYGLSGNVAMLSKSCLTVPNSNPKFVKKENSNMKINEKS